MAKAVCVVTYREITDTEGLAAYAKLAGPAMEAAGARFLARGAPALTLEGPPDRRVVVLEFDSVEAAEAAYRSAADQSAREALGHAAVRDDRIVPACA